MGRSGSKVSARIPIPDHHCRRRHPLQDRAHVSRLTTSTPNWGAGVCVGVCAPRGSFVGGISGCTWAFTPGFRGFERFVGFYDAAEDHYSHEAAGAYDLRDGIEPDREQRGVYSTDLFAAAAAAVDFIASSSEGAGSSGSSSGCAAVKLEHDTSVGGKAIAVLHSADPGACCDLCTASRTCVASSFDRQQCFLKNDMTSVHPKAGVTSGVLRGVPPAPTPNPAPPVPPPVPGGATAPLFCLFGVPGGPLTAAGARRVHRPVPERGGTRPQDSLWDDAGQQVLHPAAQLIKRTSAFAFNGSSTSATPTVAGRPTRGSSRQGRW